MPTDTGCHALDDLITLICHNFDIMVCRSVSALDSPSINDFVAKVTMYMQSTESDCGQNVPYAVCCLG